MSVTEQAAAERRDLADFLETLTPQEWDTRTLCPEWTVKQTAAHVISYDQLGARALAGRMVRGLFQIDRTNAIGVREYGRRSPEELVRLLRECAVPRGLTSMFGARPAVTDGTIHHQDIRRALGRPRVVPEERLRTALAFAPWAPVLPAWRNVRGLRLVATDLDWSRGDGAEVRGPGEALLMAIAGRADALPDLTGPGLPTLERRVRR
jgi:uncharacterized protein (TIGR03083 family)